MTRLTTDYERFEKSSPQNRRVLRQEQLIIEVTEALSEALERKGITKADLAQRLNKTKGFVSHILAGGRNLTLRTIADVADALECQIRVQLLEKTQEKIFRPSMGTFGNWTFSHKPSFEVRKRRIQAAPSRAFRQMRGAA